MALVSLSLQMLSLERCPIGWKGHLDLALDVARQSVRSGATDQEIASHLRMWAEWLDPQRDPCRYALAESDQEGQESTGERRDC
jgi:hypothetical protein